MFKVLLHSKKRRTCSGLLKTVLFNVVLPMLFVVVSNIVQHCYTLLRVNSGSTILFNIVDNYEQCGQQNVEQCCLNSPEQVMRFYACTWSDWYNYNTSPRVIESESRNNVFFII